MRQLAGVVDVAVVPIDDVLGDQTVAAFVVRDGDRPTTDEIRIHCRAALAAFKRPQTIEFHAGAAAHSGREGAETPAGGSVA